MLSWQERRRLVLHAGKIGHVVVERLEFAVVSVDENLIQAAIFGFTREERDAARLGIDQILRHLLQHGDAAGDVEPADAHLKAGIEKGLGDVDGTRELIGLHANQGDERLSAVPLDLLNDLLPANARVGLVNGMQDDVDIGTKDLPLAAIVGQTVEDR